MAYVSTSAPQDEEEQKKKTTTTSASSTLEGGNGSAPGGRASTTGSWVNFQDYAAANKGDTSTAESVGKGLDSKVNAATQALQDYTSKESQQIKDSGFKDFNLDYNKLGDQDYGQSVRNYLTQEDKTKSNFGDVNVAAKHNEANNLWKGLSEGGTSERAAAIKSVAGDANYSRGENTLDAFLFDKGSGKQQMAARAPQLNSFGGAYQKSLTDLQSQATAQREANLGKQKSLGTALEQNADEVSKIQAAAQGLKAAADQDISSKNILHGLGDSEFSGRVGEYLSRSGEDFSQGVNRTYGNEADFMDDAQLARVNALRQFQGLDPLTRVGNKGSVSYDQQALQDLIAKSGRMRIDQEHSVPRSDVTPVSKTRKPLGTVAGYDALGNVKPGYNPEAANPGQEATMSAQEAALLQMLGGY